VLELGLGPEACRGWCPGGGTRATFFDAYSNPAPGNRTFRIPLLFLGRDDSSPRTEGYGSPGGDTVRNDGYHSNISTNLETRQQCIG